MSACAQVLRSSHSARREGDTATKQRGGTGGRYGTWRKRKKGVCGITTGARAEGTNRAAVHSAHVGGVPTRLERARTCRSVVE